MKRILTLCLALLASPLAAQDLAMAIGPRAAPLMNLPAPNAAGREIVVTFGGDVNFARSRQKPSPDMSVKFGRHSWAKLTEHVGPEWNGDVNFVNVETVVGERDGSMSGKTFVFRSHPNAFRHLMDLGVNAFALANNHAHDHGRAGMAMTRDFFDAEARTRPIVAAGVGVGERAFAPSVQVIGGVRVALSAMSFGSGMGPRADAPGMAYLFDPQHFAAVTKGLREAKADLKLLSIHYGTENQVTLNGGQREMYLRAMRESGAHLLLGHHPHVVRGVERTESGAIFYSLGNLLFIGGAEKDSKPVGEDYGLLGRAYFRIKAGGAQLTALEAVPFMGVHLIPRHPSGSRALRQIDHLNRLSRRTSGGEAVQFDPVGGRTRGLACFGGAYGPRARRVCCEAERSTSCELPTDLM